MSSQAQKRPQGASNQLRKVVGGMKAITVIVGFLVNLLSIVVRIVEACAVDSQDMTDKHR